MIVRRRLLSFGYLRRVISVRLAKIYVVSHRLKRCLKCRQPWSRVHFDKLIVPQLNRVVCIICVYYSVFTLNRNYSVFCFLRHKQSLSNYSLLKQNYSVTRRVTNCNRVGPVSIDLSYGFRKRIQ